MNGLDLFLLGRKLMKLGEQAMPGAGFRRLPASVQSIVFDVFGPPNSSIGVITARTGFPQSHVSASVARLQKAGGLVTTADPRDRRRTLVSPAPEVVAGIASDALAEAVSTPVDDVLARALDTTDRSTVGELVATLESLAAQLLPG